MKSDLSWTPPAEAVEPVNRFHTLYMRLVGLNEALLDEAGASEAVIRSPAFGNLVGAVNGFIAACSQMTMGIEDIRLNHPAIWEIWQRANQREFSDGIEEPEQKTGSRQAPRED